MAEKSRAEEIADHLRREILRGKLLAGAPIKERDNALEMGVSRTPMREAIRILANEGLVILRPARSPVVAKLSLKEVKDAIDVLSALELLSVRLACEHATDEDLAAIRVAERHIAENFETLEDIERFEADMRFHIAIAGASHNAALAETHMSYLARMWRARFLSANRQRSRDTVVEQHAAIVAGLEARDPDLAQEKLQVHLDRLLLNVREFFEAENDNKEPGTKAG
ncbi:Transcriptional regulator, GntR family [Rhodovulum sp. P5]|uniref:GntR family transcriptional regulator n=1 Tax=Rhodovulum sp. P5 TaxID=1564506 RepID=UPI0009C3762C|nr:GntR family transcriptional regulator [Rhodovulum sp. P5]ARE42089.1 Transcriptional regulator, GntR family [Rhodovulum sp. P5]